MRLIVEIGLRDNTIMNIVADTQSKESARNIAVQLSSRLFADSRFFVYSSSPILRVEKWAKDKHINHQSGNKKFMAAFMLNGGVQFLQVQAAGVKSAYNSIKIKYGIQENLFMMIYEVNQNMQSRSIMNCAQQVLLDNNKIKGLSRAVVSKVSTTPEYETYRDEIVLLLFLIKDYIDNDYKCISSIDVIGITSVMVYILNPEGFVLDIVPGMDVMSELELICWAIKQLSNDIKNYTDWINIREVSAEG